MGDKAQATPFNTKAKILGDLWLNFRKDPNFSDFIEYNDLGLPLAYAISEGMIQVSPTAENYVVETFQVLLSGLELEDTGFRHLEELLSQAKEK